MPKERRQEARIVAVRRSPARTIIACLCCLAAGLAIGYFYGRESSRATAPAGAPPAPLGSTPTFLQDEMALKSILGSNPNDYGTVVRLGTLYYDNGRFAEAVEWYGKALALDPRDPNVRTDRGTSYYNLNQPDAALAEFSKALEFSPGHAQTLYNMGVVYLHGKNDPGQARRVWEKLLATNPNYPDRAKVQEQIAALPVSPAEGSPAQDSRPAGVEDLLDRLRKQP